MSNNHDSGLTLVFFAALGTILVIAIVGIVLWLQMIMPGGRSMSSQGSGFDFHSGSKVRLQTTEAQAVDMEAVTAAINKGGCITCHTIPGISGAVGQIGPDLSQIGVAAAQRREGYTIEKYLRESILTPEAFTAPDCPTGPCPSGVMPTIQFSEAEIEAIVNYLTTLGVKEVAHNN